MIPDFPLKWLDEKERAEFAMTKECIEQDITLLSRHLLLLEDLNLLDFHYGGPLKEYFASVSNAFERGLEALMMLERQLRNIEKDIRGN